MEPDRRPVIVSRIVIGTGALLTAGLFSGYRPWGDTPANFVFLLGPVILAAGAASRSARSRPVAGSGGGSSASRVAALGVIMLLIGGCPWLYTPLSTPGGGDDSASGMLGTIIFLLIGLPGLAVTAIGLFQVAAQRRARHAAGRREVESRAAEP